MNKYSKLIDKYFYMTYNWPLKNQFVADVGRSLFHWVERNIWDSVYGASYVFYLCYGPVTPIFAKNITFK
jgi:hypothetical protein